MYILYSASRKLPENIPLMLRQNRIGPRGSRGSSRQLRKGIRDPFGNAKIVLESLWAMPRSFFRDTLGNAVRILETLWANSHFTGVSIRFRWLQ